MAEIIPKSPPSNTGKIKVKSCPMLAVYVINLYPYSNLIVKPYQSNHKYKLKQVLK